MFMEVETCISGYFVVYRGGGKAIGQYSNGISVYQMYVSRFTGDEDVVLRMPPGRRVSDLK